MKPLRAPCLILLLLLTACGQAPAHGDEPKEAEPHGMAPRHETGPIKPSSTNLPFLKIQAIALGAVPGEVVRVDLEEEHGKDIYEFKILAASGRVIELEIDAGTGQILKQEAD